MEINEKIILFDGTCGFCNSWIQLILKYDKKEIFQYAPLQSKLGEQLLIKIGFPLAYSDSIVFLDGNKFWIGSDAIFKIIQHLTKNKSFVNMLFLIPKNFRDFLYNFIRHNRYRLTRKNNLCNIPSRFISD